MSFKPPQAGELVHLGQVKRLNQTGEDSNGQPVGDEVLVTDAYIKREAISGRIAEIAHQQFSAATHMLTLRYHSGINRTCWVEIDGARYEIGFVDVMGLEWIRLTCEESWPQGQPA